MSVESWDAWVRVTRDLSIVAVGCFILIYETVFASTPSIELIGAGLGLLGAPAAIRLDLRGHESRTQKGSGEGTDQ